MIRTVQKAMAPIKRRIYLMIGRAVLTAVTEGGKRQFVQFSALKGETKDKVQRAGQYGFSSYPLGGAEVIFACVGGNRDHPVAISVDDPRYRPTFLQPGETIIYNDQNVTIHLTKDKKVVVKAVEIILEATGKIRCDTPLFEVTGEIIDRCDTDGTTMSHMRETYDIHTHDENNNDGDPTDIPNQIMGA